MLDKVVDPILGLPRPMKRLIAMSVDASLCVLTVWVAFYLRLGTWVPLSGPGWPAAVLALLAIPVFLVLGLYRTVFRHAGWETLIRTAQAVVVYGSVYASIVTAFGIMGVPRTVGLIQPILLFVALTLSRSFGRYWLGGHWRERFAGRSHRRNVLIYGAGSAGRQLAAALGQSAAFRAVGFVDDDPNLDGSVIRGLRVSARIRIPDLIQRMEVEEVFLAIPSADRRRRNEVIALLRSLGLAVRTLPGILDIAHGRVTVTDLRPLEIDDLLGRDAVAPDEQLIERNIRGKCVLVTGAGGSIGSELCRQIMLVRPKTLLLLEQSEYALYSIHRELENGPGGSEDIEIVPLLGSVTDHDRLHEIFRAWKPATVYHAAAYKHVPLVEHNLIEGVRNNVLGTWCTASVARAHGVSDFVLVSTDKAVRPTNVMGASKRLAEIALQAIAADSPAGRFSMVRFGNVLGSSGSVVPLFRSQIALGGPITVTHQEITRFFMTIPEAAQLVIQAGAMARGGEVFVLDMGEPVRVVDLARRMVELSGLQVRDEANPDGDIEIVFSGLRPGEKLYEELLIGNQPSPTAHPRVMKASEGHLPLGELEALLKRIRTAIERRDAVEVRSLLAYAVPEYTPAAEIVDWVANKTGPTHVLVETMASAS